MSRILLTDKPFKISSIESLLFGFAFFIVCYLFITTLKDKEETLKEENLSTQQVTPEFLNESNPANSSDEDYIFETESGFRYYKEMNSIEYISYPSVHFEPISEKYRIMAKDFNFTEDSEIPPELNIE